jgi:hypothetical protein
MHKKKISKWVLIAIGVVLFAAIVSILYGEGYLNLGALGVKVKRTTQTECKEGAEKEDKYCVYTLEPIQYFVMPDGSNYAIYGDNITKLFTDNKLVINDGYSLSAMSYSLVRPSPNTTAQVATSPFTTFNLGFKYTDKNGKKIPVITMDKATATRCKGARFVEVELPKMVKVRLNSFYLPK